MSIVRPITPDEAQRELPRLQSRKSKLDATIERVIGEEFASCTKSMVGTWKAIFQVTVNLTMLT